MRWHRALLAGAALVGSGLLAQAGPLAAAPGDDAVAEAIAAIAREDGVAAEIAGKRALEEGKPRAAVAALIGEGELLQGDLADARAWLGAGEFDAASRQRGLHALARLEMAEENLPQARSVLEGMLAEGLASAEVWVDLGRILYRMGDQRRAIEASRQAVASDPDDPRALEFAAQLARDSQGLRAAVPLFRAAVETAPDDQELAAQYAATLGDAGDYAGMLEVIRSLTEDDGAIPQVFYLQAVLAARAGDDDLARSLWWRTEGAFDGTAAGLLISGVLEYRSGNPALAVERFAELNRLQPVNSTGQVLLARALVANGEAIVAVPLLRPLAERPDAAPYVLVLLARAYEQLGQRDLAAPLLDRAAAWVPPGMALQPALVLRDEAGRVSNPDDPVQTVRLMVEQGRIAEAQALVDGAAAQFDGSADFAMLAGDIALLGGDIDRALALYRQAAVVRSNWPLVQRMAVAFSMQGQGTAARNTLAAHLRANPQEQAAALLLGRLYLAGGNAARAAPLLRHAGAFGAGPSDPLLLADLAEAELALGNGEAALDRAEAAHRLSRANRRVARVLARMLEMQGGGGAGVATLRVKAQAAPAS